MASLAHADRRLPPVHNTFIHVGKTAEHSCSRRSRSYSGYTSFSQAARKLDAMFVIAGGMHQSARGKTLEESDHGSQHPSGNTTSEDQELATATQGSDAGIECCLEAQSSYSNDNCWPDTDSECGYEPDGHSRSKTWTCGEDEYRFNGDPSKHGACLNSSPTMEAQVAVPQGVLISAPGFHLKTTATLVAGHVSENVSTQPIPAVATQDQIQALAMTIKLASEALAASTAPNTEALVQHAQHLERMLASLVGSAAASPHVFPSLSSGLVGSINSTPPHKQLLGPLSGSAKAVPLDLSSFLDGNMKQVQNSALGQSSAFSAPEAVAPLPTLLRSRGQQANSEQGNVLPQKAIQFGVAQIKKPVKLDLDLLVVDALANKKSETTLMIKNLPLDLAQKQLLNELDERGFKDLYDFCYMPRCFGSADSQGFAFVNLISSQAATALTAAWNSKLLFESKKEVKPLKVVPANVQGYEGNIAKWAGPRMQRIRNPEHWPFVREGAKDLSTAFGGRRKLPATSPLAVPEVLKSPSTGWQRTSLASTSLASR